MLDQMSLPKSPLFALTCALFGCVAGVSHAAAGEYGALVYNRAGAFGYTASYADRDNAVTIARVYCLKYAVNCPNAKAFRNTCVTVARNRGAGPGHIAWATGRNKAERTKDALDECRDNGAEACEIVLEFCTGSISDDR